MAHRAMVVCVSQPALKQEKDHIRQGLLRYSYSPWASNRLHNRINHRFNTHHDQRVDSR